jgi:3-oxoacyl-[acyl-carrier protein] reductase
MASMGVLTGKGALVTGGSRGIGRAIVRRLAADGAAVVFSYLSNEKAAQEVVDGAGGKAFAVRADQGSLADLSRLFEEADAYLDGGLDIVVCNAADGLPIAIKDATEHIYDRYMAVNAKGPFFTIQQAGATLRDGGRIIAISTANTRLHPPGGALYTGSKGSDRIRRPGHHGEHRLAWRDGHRAAPQRQPRRDIRGRDSGDGAEAPGPP